MSIWVSAPGTYYHLIDLAASEVTGVRGLTHAVVVCRAPVPEAGWVVIATDPGEIERCRHCLKGGPKA